jgi:gamma-glutamylcyclotransferase (GGCT)/AIG2-like uncharacterized protein YtfP
MDTKESIWGNEATLDEIFNSVFMRWYLRLKNHNTRCWGRIFQADGQGMIWIYLSQEQKGGQCCMSTMSKWQGGTRVGQRGHT